MNKVLDAIRRWFENAVLEPLFVWALYRHTRPRQRASATDVFFCVSAFGAFAMLVASAIASTAPLLPAPHVAAHAKACALAKALEQHVDVSR
jgi:hypothetical protein